MKRFNLLFLLTMAVVTITTAPGCFFNINDDGDGIFGCIDGSGPTVTQDINLANFTGIDLQMDADVFITQGNDQEVRIEGKQNIIDHIKRSVSGGIWEIDTDHCTRDRGDMKIFITIPDITSLKISGSGRITGQNTFVVGDIDLNISGSGDIDLGLQADDVTGKISGSGAILLEGTGDELNMKISGSGDLNAFDMEFRNAFVEITGSGDADVRVTDNLTVKITGSGDVFYKGNPVLDVTITGSGRVVNAN